MHPSAIIAFGIATAGMAMAWAEDIFHGYPLSDTCQSSILAVSSSPISKCLDIPGLYKVIALPKDKDWLDPVSNWLNNACGLKDCDSGALTSVVTGVINACKADIELLGYGDIPDYLSEKHSLYLKAGKNALCSRNKSNKNGLCVRDLALKIKKIYGINYKPEDWSKSFYNVVLFGRDKDDRYPSEVVCDKCGLAIYNELKGTFPEVTQVEPYWNYQCAAKFHFWNAIGPRGILHFFSTED